MTKEREDLIRAHPSWNHDLIDELDATRAALQQAEETLAEAWKEARDIGDYIDITADNLPALICGIGDKYSQRLTKADEALVIDQHRIGKIFMEREDVKQRLAQVEQVARGLLAVAKYKVCDNPGGEQNVQQD